MASESMRRPQDVGADQHDYAEHKEGGEDPDPAPVSRRVSGALNATLVREEGPTDQNDRQVHRQGECDEGEGPVVLEVLDHWHIVSRPAQVEVGFRWCASKAARRPLRLRYRS